MVLGGYIILDDYGTWPGCRKAVHEFIDKNDIKADLKFIGVYDPVAFKRLLPVYFKKVE